MALSQEGPKSWVQVIPESTKTKFIWTIEDFSSRYIAPSQVIRSADFYTGKDCKDQWRLILHPKVQCKYHDDSVRIYLHSIERSNPNITVDVIFSIVEPGSHDTTNKRRFLDEVFERENPCLRVNIINSSDIPKFLEDDVLKLCIELIPKSNKNLSSGVSLKEPMKVTPGNINAELSEELDTFGPRLIDQLWMEFQNPKNSDVIIIVENEHFNVHKFILEIRSPVFAAMFEHKMEESTTKKIVIEGIRPEVVEKMLQFMYIDTINNYEDMVGELLIAADRYSLDGLKMFCARFIGACLTISNAVETLIIADVCNSKYLKNHVAKFIISNLPVIMKTSDYAKLEKNHPELGCYLLRLMASRMIEN